jgi:Protein of unknown function (DUF3040)
MLSDSEQRALAEIERSLAAEDQERVRIPAGAGRPEGRAGGHPVARVLTAVGGAISVLLLLGEVPTAALAVAIATGLLWFLWSHWAQLSDRGEPLPTVGDGRPGRARMWRYVHRFFTHLLRMAEAE